MKKLNFIYIYKNKKYLNLFLKTYKGNLDNLFIYHDNIFYQFKNFMNKTQKESTNINFNYAFQICDFNFIFNDFFWFFMEKYLDLNKFNVFDLFYFNKKKIFTEKYFLSLSYETFLFMIKEKHEFKNFLSYISNIIFPSNFVNEKILKEIVNGNILNCWDEIFDNISLKNFSYIDLLNGYKINNNHVSFNKDYAWKINNYYNLFKKINNADIISFDFFDTLVYRKTLHPEDIFHLLEMDFNLKFKTNIYKIINIRKNSQINFSDKLIHKRYDEIYDDMVKKYPLNSEQINYLKTKEIELEKKYIDIKKFGLYLLEYALWLNKKVIVLSDMYLSDKTLKNILSKFVSNNKINSIDFYVSADLKLSKHVGNIYSFIIDKYKSNKIVHFGDNYNSDYLNAKKYGIESYYLISSYDLAKKCMILDFYDKEIVKNKKYILYMGMLIATYFNNPSIEYDERVVNLLDYHIHFFISFFYLSIFTWIIKKLKSKFNGTLYLLSRDGYMLKNIFNIYKDISRSKINVEYVYHSRKIHYLCFFADDQFWNHFINYFLYDKTIVRTIGITPYDIKNSNIFFKNFLGFDEKFIEENIDKSLLNVNINEFEDIENIRNRLIREFPKTWIKIQNSKDNIVEHYKNIFSTNDGDFIFDTGSFNNERLFLSMFNKKINAFYLGSKNENNVVYDLLNKTKTFNYLNQECSIPWQLIEYLLHDANSPSLRTVNNGSALFCNEKNDLKTANIITFIQNISLMNIKFFLELYSNYLDFLYVSELSDNELFFSTFLEANFKNQNSLLNHINITDDVYDNSKRKLFDKKIAMKNLHIQFKDYKLSLYLNERNLIIKCLLLNMKLLLKIRRKLLKFFKK